jgi:ATP-dependent Clp protease ATP-binding subunit ClpB
MARKQGDLAKAAELLHSVIPTLEHEMEELEKEDQSAPAGQQHHKMLADFVSAEAIATVVARHTGIPVSRITGSESRKLLHLEDKLRERVVGQDAALSAVSQCVRLARTRLQAPNRTLGNFLFVGPTGVVRLRLLEYYQLQESDKSSNHHTILTLTLCNRAKLSCVKLWRSPCLMTTMR